DAQDVAQFAFERALPARRPKTALTESAGSEQPTLADREIERVDRERAPVPRQTGREGKPDRYPGDVCLHVLQIDERLSVTWRAQLTFHRCAEAGVPRDIAFA